MPQSFIGRSWDGDFGQGLGQPTGDAIMSASRRADSSNPSTASVAGTESLTRSVQESFATAMGIPKKIMEANLDTGAELLTFMSRRMKAQAELFNGVGHCHDLSEASDMQRTFWEKVTRDYSQEMNHLAEITRKNFDSVSGLISIKPDGSGSQGRTI
jgi:hypothetical protein